jgi:hypothetical protein
MTASRVYDAFEARLKRLVGRSLRGVAYREIAYDNAEPGWRAESASFDSLDFGLELHVDDGSIISFTWGAEFVQYNVSVVDGELQLGDNARAGGILANAGGRSDYSAR